MKASELRKKTKADLLQDLEARRIDLLKLRIRNKNVAVDESKKLSTHMFKSLRREIARIETVLTELKNVEMTNE